MISKGELEELIAACEQALRACGRELIIEKGTPASQMDITMVEKQLGRRVPPSLANFLTIFNGLSLEAPSRDTENFSRAIRIMNTTELIRNAPLGETAIRAIMRSRGFVDTKVASVSERLTALRFVDRR